MNCAAGIVLFYPNWSRLFENINAIYDQVDVIYCYNNGTDSNANITQKLASFSKIRILGEGINDGISKALNVISKEAKRNDVEWLLTLDQDSVCSQGMIEKFLQYTSMNKVGAICPVIVDKRRPLKAINGEEITEIDFCITSGCFMSLSAFFEIGMMDEFLFIGLVDNEYCFRLRKYGYRILQVNSIVLDHELGDLRPSRFSKLFLELGDWLKCERLKALSYKRKVSPMRVFYATRNILYLEKKHPKSGVKEFSRTFAIYNGISNVLRSDRKLEVLKAFIKGMCYKEN